jgi:hypothetical protein
LSLGRSSRLSFHPTSGGKQITKLSTQTPATHEKLFAEVRLKVFRFLSTVCSRDNELRKQRIERSDINIQRVYKVPPGFQDKTVHKKLS